MTKASKNQSVTMRGGKNVSCESPTPQNTTKADTNKSKSPETTPESKPEKSDQ